MHPLQRRHSDPREAAVISVQHRNFSLTFCLHGYPEYLHFYSYSLPLLFRLILCFIRPFGRISLTCLIFPLGYWFVFHYWRLAYTTYLSCNCFLSFLQRHCSLRFNHLWAASWHLFCTRTCWLVMIPVRKALRVCKVSIQILFIKYNNTQKERIV